MSVGLSALRALASKHDLGSEHADVGRLIGDRQIGEGSLHDLMQDGHGVLLDASEHGQASRLVAAATPRVRCVAVAAGPSMLIRPDACVAWATDGGGTDGLQDALRRWFNPGLADVAA